jgi:hypothetical protein
LGFVVGIALRVARKHANRNVAKRLSEVVKTLEEARLANTDTLCQQSLPPSRRKFAHQQRSALAAYWKLDTRLTEEKEFLQDLDAIVTESCRLPCFGCFAVSIEYGISRSTLDIDVLDVAPPYIVAILHKEGGKGSPLAIKHHVYLDVVGIANAPLDYESRLRHMFPGAFQYICLMVMDPYDIALTKLKRDSDKDFQDVLQLAEKIPFDLDLFEKRYTEELRDNMTGKPEDNDRTFYRWKEAILENRSHKR